MPIDYLEDAPAYRVGYNPEFQKKYGKKTGRRSPDHLGMNKEQTGEEVMLTIQDMVEKQPKHRYSLYEIGDKTLDECMAKAISDTGAIKHLLKKTQLQGVELFARQYFFWLAYKYSGKPTKVIGARLGIEPTSVLRGVRSIPYKAKDIGFILPDQGWVI